MFSMAPWTMTNVWIFILTVEYILLNRGISAFLCGNGKTENENGECVPCDGPCPKICQGFGWPGERYKQVNENNIDDFIGCVIINGSMVLETTTFDGDPLKGLVAIEMEKLDNFHTVQIITGHLEVSHSGNTQADLSAFKNLHTIHGNTLKDGRSLIITNTYLTSLGMTSLQRVNLGDVYIRSNSLLCYITKDMITGILRDIDTQRALVGSNRRRAQCSEDGYVCDSQCSLSHCWGPGPTQCVDCVNFIQDDTCIATCDPNDGYYNVSDRCAPCDEQCLNSCRGPGPTNCTACKNVQDGNLCLAECPTTKYPDEGKICQNCHSNCRTSGELAGCTGPENNVGDNGCKSCDRVLKDGPNVQCMAPEMQCPLDFFEFNEGGTIVCQRCHAECVACSGPGSDNCFKCRNVELRGRCVASCPGTHYVDDNNVCQTCHGECLGGCYGGDGSQCNDCKNYKMSMEDQGFNDTFFQCVSECPIDKPYTMYAGDDEWCVANCTGNTFGNKEMVCQDCHQECLDGCTDERSSTCFNCRKYRTVNGYCVPSCDLESAEVEDGICRPLSSKKPNTGGVSTTPIIIGSVVALIPIVVIVVLLVWYVRRQRELDEKRDRYLQVGTSDMPMDTFEDAENLEPSGAHPNKAYLRIISESELQKGGILGAGAFGTVYKGLWLPEGDQVRIPVAIKVLHEGMSSKANQELLEEAYLMASTNHENVVRLLCVSMSHQMMLVTQLLPLGALIDYLRKNKKIIGSQHILNWCVQIAKGMYYLETKRLVHRDLAARNVLVETPSRVKITDFGLAKFIEVNQDEYTAGGGKMPIKWLALECITHRRFTHQSDVWSFGVTLWETMTFGGKPYEGVRPREIPDLLEKGERLKQPEICTIEVYMLMLKCWMLDEDSRPTFKELVEEFMRMARDPHRYLVIENDVSTPIESPTKSEFYRNLLPDESPELLMDADEYLLPASLSVVSESEHEPEIEAGNGSVVHEYESPIDSPVDSPINSPVDCPDDFPTDSPPEIPTNIKAVKT